ncbi:hypothetical protein CDD81_4174 [Ophiocordyceps australis]|uniref:Uncharacterized protein n=1 Tax=Ophiocordyceps australis TaxID=1399860 RepID=A0A2C5XVC9_9HYPO|nr:hypothetical protein CDD81_4174 [Ophiocordyceps australis]
MAVLGKRKSPEFRDSQDAAEIFRRHFESRFEPLGVSSPAQEEVSDGAENSNSEDQESNSEWDGLSDAGQDQETATAVLVVDHSTSQTPQAATMTKRQLKDFMSARPPDPAMAPNNQSTPPIAPVTSSLPEDAPSLLAQDLELRRLLAESHLLAPRPLSLSSTAATTQPRAFAEGRIRQKATDLRIQALGSSVSLLKQDKMPMQVRKGIVANAKARETKRRREARENGVILERQVDKTKPRKRTRERPVDRPGVGRLKGAELRLSERDIKSIEGKRDIFGRPSKR